MAPPPIAPPLINGKRYSYTSIKSDFGQLDQLGMVEINYNDSLEPGVGRGTSPQDLGTTTGDYKAAGSITMLRAEYDRYVVARAAMSSDGQSFMTPSEDITITYADTGLPTTTDKLFAVRIVKNDHSNKGKDPTQVKCDLYVGIIGRKPPGASDFIFPFEGAQIA